ncbi:MAG: hypothetical protein ACE1Z8_10730, partial [Candidatus Acidiferrales bacterium]
VNDEGMHYLREEIAKLGLEQIPSQANFILIRVEKSQAVFDRLLRRGVRLNNEVPGIVVPESVQKMLEQAGTGARDKGFQLARELLVWAKTATAGAYIIPPFKKYEEALDVLT